MDTKHISITDVIERLNEFPTAWKKVIGMSISKWEKPMPAHLVPFSPDGFGNHYCFDVKSHHIVFWEHDVDYTQHHPIVICKSLAEFIQNEMIEEIF